MKVRVNRHAHFNAAHRLYSSQWTEDRNKEVFGKCANPHYHGHNYELIVGVKGEVDPQTGFVVDMKWLADLIAEKVEDYLDHKNLNEQIPEFKNVNPTAENIAIVIWNILRPEVPEPYELKVTLYETPRNFVEYYGS